MVGDSEVLERWVRSVAVSGGGVDFVGMAGEELDMEGLAWEGLAWKVSVAAGWVGGVSGA